MASEKSVNSNSQNVQVKIEPGTSTPVSSASVPLNIKTEPGLPTITQRLTSFRLPRDLTLGGNVKTEKSKKVYTPNINAQRNKKKDEVTSTKADLAKLKNKDCVKGRGRGDKGRGRGNLIQSAGVWSEGINVSAARHRRYGGSGDNNLEAKPSLEKPKLNLNKIIDKAEEEEKLKDLLRDDFIDDGTDADLDKNIIPPIMLPLFEEGKFFKTYNKTETDIHNDEKIDSKSAILEAGGAIKKEQYLKTKKNKEASKKNKEHVHITIPEIIENKSNSYTLIQFPSSLPGLVSNKEESKPKRSNDSSKHNENDSKAKNEYCTLNNLKNGYLGKLEILKSGKARLRLGENNLIVELGSIPSFHQDLVAAKVDTVSSTGDLINLGAVTNTLLCTPDWESMLEN